MGKLFDFVVHNTEASYESWIKSGIGQQMLEMRDRYSESSRKFESPK
jgi:hypothetical protein